MDFLKNAFTFEGRVSRTTFWVNTLVCGLLSIFLSYRYVNMYVSYYDFEEHTYITNKPVYFIGVAIIGLRVLSVSVRRWHDLDKSGWFSLATLFIVLNSVEIIDLPDSWYWLGLMISAVLALVILGFQGFVPGNPGPNQYGPASGSFPTSSGTVDPRRSVYSRPPVDQEWPAITPASTSASDTTLRATSSTHSLTAHTPAWASAARPESLDIGLPRSELRALAAATIMSLLGSVITIFALTRLMYSYVQTPNGYYKYSHILLVIVTVVLCWLVGSHYDEDIADRVGFKGVSLFTDIVSALAIVAGGILFHSFTLLLVLAAASLVLRFAALSAYRSKTPALSVYMGQSVDRVNSLFDSFPYAGLLIMSFVFNPLQIHVWKMFHLQHIEWVYAAILVSSALLVTLMISSEAFAVRPALDPEPTSAS